MVTQPEPDLDRLERERLTRSEHEATHGEAEQCGVECIELGLADFDEDDLDAMAAGNFA